MTSYESQVTAFKAKKSVGGTTPVPLTTVDCRFLGEKIVGQPCATPLFKCNKFGEITSRWTKCDKATRHCATCQVPDDEKFPKTVSSHLPILPIQPIQVPQTPKIYGPVGKRHLIYHILPVSGNGVWRKGVDQLRMRWSLFTGKKIVTVATGGHVQERVDNSERVGSSTRRLSIETIDVVKRYLPADTDVIEVHNDPNTWELVSWPLLWNQVLDEINSDDAVLYAHAKGVTRKVTSPCHLWTDLLYTLSLDHWGVVEKLFNNNRLVVGSLLKMGPYFGGVLSGSRWHYSGNFWWTRAGAIRERLESVPVPIDRWATEAWIGIAFSLHEAGVIFSPPYGVNHLYSPIEMQKLMVYYDRWLALNPPHIPVTPDDTG